MSWDAAARTIAARLDAVSRLPALLSAAGLPAIATDPSGAAGLAVYDSPRLSYASPCVEVMPVEGAVEHKSLASTSTELSGWVSLSWQTTDPTGMADTASGYLAALMAAFVPRESPDEYWEVDYATTSPASRQGDGPYVQAVAVKVTHTITEHV